MSASCGSKCLNESTDIFTDVLFRPLQGTLGFVTLYTGQSMSTFSQAPKCVLPSG